MKKLLIALILSFTSFISFAQPANGTYGNVSFNGRAHAWYRATGWSASDPNSYIAIFWGGDGQDPANFATFDDVAPNSMLASGQWNGTTVLPSGGGTIRWLIFTLGNTGTTTLAATDLQYFWQNLVPTFDTAQKTRVLQLALSGGPARMWDYVRNFPTHNSPYREVYGMSISMSVTAIFNDLTAYSVNKKHYLWYGDADANSGTPPSFTINMYNNLIAGTPNVDKRLKFTAGGTHSNNTWGIYNNINTCLAVTGTDSSTNRWIWAAQAYGAPGMNVGPTANAGVDQTVVLPTSFATLNGSGSTDPDNGIATYQWIKLTGPAGGTITTPGPSSGAVTTTITSLQQGLYTYRLIVVDNGGLSDDDTVAVSVTNGVPSSNLITFDVGNQLWPWSAKENPGRLFDGSTVEGNRIDDNNQIQFANPVIWFMELKDSVYENIKLEFFNGFGSTQTWNVNFYDSNKVQLGAYSFTGASLPFTNWMTMAGSPDTIVKPIKWIRFQCSNALSDVREIRVYGDKVAKVTTLYPTSVTPTTLIDPGIWSMGGSAIEGKDTTYMKLASGKPLYPSFRHPTGQIVYNARDGQAFNAQSITVNRFGDIVNGHFKFFKRRGGKNMMYTTGASMGARGAFLGLTYSSNYNELAAANSYKDIVIGTDSTLPASWINTGRFWKGLAAIWGNNLSAVLTPDYTFELDGSQSSAKGQDLLQSIEVSNEEDKTWQGDNGYSTPAAQYAKLRTAYDSIRTVEPNIDVRVGATIQIDTARWKAMFFIHYWQFGGTRANFPANGFNFNQYISSAYSGQPQTGNEDAISPERFKIKEIFTNLGNFRDRHFPGRDFRWTEIGFSTTNSDYSVVELPGLADSVVAAMLMIRSFERGLCVPNVMSVIYNYFHTSDGSGTFGGMFMVREKFNGGGAYIGSDRRPLWYMYAMRINTLWDYKGWSTLVTDGDSTGVNVYRREHNTDPTKKVYTLYMGTYTGATSSNYVLNVGAATSAMLVTYAFGNETGIMTPLTITSGNVTVPLVNEIPAYIIVGTNPLGPTGGNKVTRPAGVKWNVIQQF